MRKDTVRTAISIPELETELNGAFLQKGYNVIEFTLATDPKFSASELEKYVNSAGGFLKGKNGSGILLCSDF